MTPKQSKPKPPAHLAAATKKWWSQVLADYELDSHHVKLLTLAAESWDRCQAARQAIQKHGITYTDRFGTPRSRPEVVIERDARTAFARLIRELNLDIESPPESRPPRGARY